MNSLRGHGHGKVILLGEHSVVYGRPAIAAAIPLGCTARGELAKQDALTVDPWGGTVYPDREESHPEREKLRRAFQAVCERCSSQRPALSIHADMQIPGGAGLGGSAALSVAVLRVLDAAAGVKHTDSELVALSLEWEHKFHGNASGIDSAMAVGGGLAWYVRGQALLPLPAATPLTLVVANSGEHGSTMKTVGRVGELHAADPSQTGKRFDRIAELVHTARAAIASGDHATLGAVMNENQTHLGPLEVSTPTLDRMCEIARGAGALGAKLTGGGGGGCMIALASDAAASGEIAGALSSAGYVAFVVEVTP